MQPLLTPQTLARLEAYDLVSRKIFQGRFKGDRRSTRKGRSVEFADFRNYSQGDDLRFVDWNGFARLDRLFVKLFLEEEDLHVYGLLDASPSMDFGTPSKFQVGKQLLAALGFIGLVRSHRVKIETLGQSLKSPGPVWRGRHHAWRMFEHLQGLAPSQKSSLVDGVRNFGVRNSGRGILVLVSDLMDKQGYAEALRYLSARKFDVYVIHLLSQEELHPELMGDLKLVDCEDDETTELTVADHLLKAYDRTLQGYLQEVRDFCARRSLNYALIDNRTSVERVVFDLLRKQGLVG